MAATKKRPVEQIVEENFDSSSIEGMALNIVEFQADLTNFVDSFGKRDGGIDWSVVDYYELAHEFIELCQRVANYPVEL